MFFLKWNEWKNPQFNFSGQNLSIECNFSKFYGKVGVISWFLFHLIWKNYVLYWDFDLKSWIVDFCTRFTREKTPQNNFSCQNFSVENNWSFYVTISVWNFILSHALSKNTKDVCAACIFQAENIFKFIHTESRPSKN